MARLGEAAAARLEAAGWRPGRQVPVAAYVDALAALGFIAPDILTAFYTEFGGLTVAYPDPRDPEWMNTYIIDPVEAPLISSTAWIETWGEWLGVTLCPFGEADRMLAIMSPDGRVWLGFDDLLLFVADSPKESVNVLCEGRDTPRVAPPSDFSRRFPEMHPESPDREAAGRGEAEQRIEQARAQQAGDLDLSGLDLCGLPESLSSLTWLTELNLKDNLLMSLPDSLGVLTRLAWLSISGNRLTELPESIGNLAELTYLNLNENQLTALPETIGRLRKVEFLGLVGNKLAALPDAIGDLASLTKLYAPGNELTRLPDSITRLVQLEELWLSRNQLTRLPEALDQLAALKSLSVDGNPISRN